MSKQSMKIRKQARHLAWIAILLSGTVANAQAKDVTDVVLYGVGSTPCAMITTQFKGDLGLVVIQSYLNGFATATNMASEVTNDIFGGTSSLVLATRVFKYCKTHPSENGNAAVLDVLSSNMKGPSY